MVVSNDPIELALGLRPIDDVPAEDFTADDTAVVPFFPDSVSVVSTIVSADEDETVQDIEIARSNIKNIIEQGDDSLKEMVNLAKQSESPRAYEVAAILMKTLLDANKDFVDMSMKKKYAKEEIINPKDAATTNVTNNNLILSTADLLKMLKGDDI